MPCIVWPSFLTAKLILPAFIVVVLALMNMSPSVMSTSASAAAFALCPAPACPAPPMSWPAPRGAFVVGRTPIAPLTASPKACVTNG